MGDGLVWEDKCLGFQKTSCDRKRKKSSRRRKLFKRIKEKTMSKKERIHGYYFDGETQWVMIEDEDGYIEMREMEDDDE